MAVQDDVQALRDAVAALERAIVLLTREQVAEPAPAAPQLQVIDDTAYPQDFWMDAEDEGLGGGR